MHHRMWPCGLVAGAAIAAGAQGAVMIDDFNSYQSVSADQNVFMNATTMPTLGAIGGERELEAMYGGGSNTVNLVANADNNSILNYNTGAGTIGMGVVIWDGVNGPGVFDATGLGGVDLTEGGSAVGLVVNVGFDDLPASLDFIIYTNAGNYSRGSIPLAGGIFDQQFQLPFASFITQAGAGADFSNVGAIVLNINSTFQGVDLQMEFLGTYVPAPGSVALMGAAGLFGIRRRRA